MRKTVTTALISYIAIVVAGCEYLQRPVDPQIREAATIATEAVNTISAEALAFQQQIDELQAQQDLSESQQRELALIEKALAKSETVILFAELQAQRANEILAGAETNEDLLVEGMVALGGSLPFLGTIGLFWKRLIEAKKKAVISDGRFVTVIGNVDRATTDGKLDFDALRSANISTGINEEIRTIRANTNGA